MIESGNRTTALFGGKKMKIIKGHFLEKQSVTVKIEGREIKRKVRYNKSDGLYIVYQNRKYFEYEFEISIEK